jgi:uncharacterized protein (DUF1499 family)
MNMKTTRSGALAIFATLALAGCSGAAPLANPPSSESRLLPCPASPNCVSSQAGADKQRVEPLRYQGDPAQAHKRLLAVLQDMERVQVKHVDAVSIHAEFRSALLGFVDDVSFHFDPPGLVQVRSASRIGYYDLGVNRRRVEDIRGRFAATAP